jgi:XTP/dITP diphosphohydrolase
MNPLVFATNNPHKLLEVKAILGNEIPVIGLNELGLNESIPEDQATIEENALQKAMYIYKLVGRDCFADDTGLEVEALHGAPGVYSARYAGPDCLAEDNICKLLKEMEDVSNRKARFRTVVALLIEGKSYLFEGVVPGSILTEKKGIAGFGYDPVFVPNGQKRKVRRNEH